jgi:hypothetical protein
MKVSGVEGGKEVGRRIVVEKVKAVGDSNSVWGRGGGSCSFVESFGEILCRNVRLEGFSTISEGF